MLELDNSVWQNRQERETRKGDASKKETAGGMKKTNDTVVSLPWQHGSTAMVTWYTAHGDNFTSTNVTVIRQARQAGTHTHTKDDTPRQAWLSQEHPPGWLNSDSMLTQAVPIWERVVQYHIPGQFSKVLHVHCTVKWDETHNPLKVSGAGIFQTSLQKANHSQVGTSKVHHLAT